MAGPWYTKGAGGTTGAGTYRGFYIASTTWAIGDIVVPTVAYATAAAKKYVYKCTTAGAGATEPTWVYTTPDTSTTTDSAAVFTCMLCDDWTHASTRPDYLATNLLAAGEYLYSENVSYPVTAAATLTFAGAINNPCYWISTADTTNMPPTSVAIGATIDASATSGISVTLAGKALVYGVHLQSGGSTGGANLEIANTDESSLQLENCTFTIANNSSLSIIRLGQSTTSNAIVKSYNCTWKLGNHTGQTMRTQCAWMSVNDIFQITTAMPSTYFSVAGFTGIINMIGGDLSLITSTLIAGSSVAYATFNFAQCKLGSGVAVLATQTGPAHCEAWLYDCAVGDTHYEFAHYNYLGNTTITAAIYMSGTDGASYNAADAKHAWKVTGVNGTYATPYVSPWINKYNEAVAAVTPRLEILRDGSTTAYNDNQVWGEFSYKGTTGFTTATIVSDRCGLVATPAAQAASALGAADWAGETTPWYGKLEPTATITPAEIGDIAARVCVAGAIAVYVNPKILGT